jgi:hypothetical protein
VSVLQELGTFWAILRDLGPVAAILLSVWALRLERRIRSQEKRLAALLHELGENGDAS